MLGLSSNLIHYFLDEEIKDEKCKGAYLKVHSEASLTFELAWWTPGSPLLLWRKIHPTVMTICEHTHVGLDTCLQTPLHYSPEKNKTFYLVVAIVEALCGNVPAGDLLRQPKCCLTNLLSWRKDYLVAKYLWTASKVIGPEFSKWL